MQHIYLLNIHNISYKVVNIDAPILSGEQQHANIPTTLTMNTKNPPKHV